MVRIYLDKPKCARKGITLDPNNQDQRVFGMYVGWDIGQAYVETATGVSDFELSDEVRDVVSHFTSHDNFYNIGGRELGTYRLGTAALEVSYVPGKQDRHHLHVRMKFRKLDDGQRLRSRFLEGTVRPDITFEQQQVPCARKRIGDLANELWQAIRQEVSDRWNDRAFIR